jgi:hypothetical protein
MLGLGGWPVGTEQDVLVSMEQEEFGMLAAPAPHGEVYEETDSEQGGSERPAETVECISRW